MALSGSPGQNFEPMNPTETELRWARKAWRDCLRRCLATIASDFALMARAVR